MTNPESFINGELSRIRGLVLFQNPYGREQEYSRTQWWLGWISKEAEISNVSVEDVKDSIYKEYSSINGISEICGR